MLSDATPTTELHTTKPEAPQPELASRATALSDTRSQGSTSDHGQPTPFRAEEEEKVSKSSGPMGKPEPINKRRLERKVEALTAILNLLKTGRTPEDWGEVRHLKDTVSCEAMDLQNLGFEDLQSILEASKQAGVAPKIKLQTFQRLLVEKSGLIPEEPSEI